MHFPYVDASSVPHAAYQSLHSRQGIVQGREEASIFSIQKAINRLNKLGISKDEIVGIISEDYGLSRTESCNRVSACLTIP